MSLNEKKNMLLFLVNWLMSILTPSNHNFVWFTMQAEQYMSNVDSTHCTPLPPEYFVVPSAGNFKVTG